LAKGFEDLLKLLVDEVRVDLLSGLSRFSHSPWTDLAYQLKVTCPLENGPASRLESDSSRVVP
jgi:hypothetical protein